MQKKKKARENKIISLPIKMQNERQATDFDRNDEQLKPNWIENLVYSWLLF